MKNTIRFITVCMAFLLVSVTCVTAVSAQQSDDQQVAEGQDIGVGGMEVTHTSVTCPVISIFGISNTENTVYDWKAGTDIWKEWLGPVKSKHYSKSRISGTDNAYDIPVIGVRGRVWKDDNSQFDQTDMEYNSADASVNYQSSEIFLSAYWKAQSDHTFEYSSNNDYWYPRTTDEEDLT